MVLQEVPFAGRYRQLMGVVRREIRMDLKTHSGCSEVLYYGNRADKVRKNSLGVAILKQVRRATVGVKCLIL